MSATVEAARLTTMRRGAADASRPTARAAGSTARLDGAPCSRIARRRSAGTGTRLKLSGRCARPARRADVRGCRDGMVGARRGRYLCTAPRPQQAAVGHHDRRLPRRPVRRRGWARHNKADSSINGADRSVRAAADRGPRRFLLAVDHRRARPGRQVALADRHVPCGDPAHLRVREASESEGCHERPDARARDAGERREGAGAGRDRRRGGEADRGASGERQCRSAELGVRHSRSGRQARAPLRSDGASA